MQPDLVKTSIFFFFFKDYAVRQSRRTLSRREGLENDQAGCVLILPQNLGQHSAGDSHSKNHAFYQQRLRKRH